ncbi:MAG: LTA synthase family protein [Halanaerobiaceae bacterium]
MFNKMNKWQKLFSVFFLAGFIIKYNFISYQIFNVPSITGLLLKNLILVLFIIYIILPSIKFSRRRLFVLAGYIIFSFLVIANVWYNRYFGNYLSYSDILMGRGVRPFKVLYRQIFYYGDILLILDIIILVYAHYKAVTEKMRYRFSNYIFKRKKSTMILIIVLLLFVQIFTTNILLGNHSPGKLYNQSSAGFVNVYGFIPLYIYEFYASFQKQPQTDTSVDFTPEIEESKEENKIIDEKPNIIVIQIESLDQKIIDYKYQDKEITPFLNNLKEESLYGNNVYSQHVNGSFDAEFSFLTSLYPLNKNYAFKVNDMSSFDSIIEILNDKGYETLAFHGNEENFFARDKAYPELGFDKFYSRKDFSQDKNVMEVEESYLGLNDYDFFQQSLDYLEEAESPFFAFMITVTSHTPFDFYPEDQAEERFMEIEEPLVRDYFQSISFVDESMKMFFEELEKRDLKEDTLFIIYSDHEAEIKKEEYYSGRDFELNKNIKPPENIPFFIVHPEIESGEINKTGTITDISPTLLELLGIENENRQFLGTSLLNEEEAPVLFLHELPQVFYQDQLFVQQSENPHNFEKVGHLQGKEEEDTKLTETQEKNIQEKINYVKDLMMKNLTESEQ